MSMKQKLNNNTIERLKKEKAKKTLAEKPILKTNLKSALK